LALGRPAGRTRWWPAMLAGAAWSPLAAILLVPPLANLHLLNWATALLVPLAWPVALWLYRYRGAPSAAFRALCRRVTLRVLTWHWRPQRAPAGRRHAQIGAAAAAMAAVDWLTARELRFAA